MKRLRKEPIRAPTRVYMFIKGVGVESSNKEAVTLVLEKQKAEQRGSKEYQLKILGSGLTTSRIPIKPRNTAIQRIRPTLCLSTGAERRVTNRGPEREMVVAIANSICLKER